jgi:hypothetical protein
MATNRTLPARRGPLPNSRNDDQIRSRAVRAHVDREGASAPISDGEAILRREKREISDRVARWLTIHAPDGGFAAFMRSVRDGVEVEWDIAPVPADGGLPASEAIVSLARAGN